MHFQDSQAINANLADVWAFVMDPDKVGGCAPGVESVVVVDDTHFRVHATVGIGVIKARFAVEVDVFDIREPVTASMRARGHAPGSAVEVVATMNLRREEQSVTVMDWQSEVNLSGKLASVGARLIEGTAQKLIGQGFACMKAQLESSL